MKKEITVKGKTVEEAVANGAAQLGMTADGVSYEVIEEAKRGFLGMGSSPATVKVFYVFKPLEAARSFAEKLISDLGLDIQVVIHDDGNGEALMTLTGADAGELIGRRGETLDAFQYLINLAANKKETDERKYTRVTLDIENYREKREQTLRQLAVRIAGKVKKIGKSMTLEPMNAYERRIIHSEIQNIEGVSTSSVGPEGNRRVVVFPEGQPTPTEETKAVVVGTDSKPRSGGSSNGNRNNRRRRPAPRKDRAAEGSVTEKTEATEKAPSSSEAGEKRTYDRAPRRDYGKRSDSPRPAPRKIEKAKDLDSYFAKLKEFSAANSISMTPEVKNDDKSDNN